MVVSILAEPVVFPFSGKTAPNRFFKAAMTERLCTYSEDEFARGEPTSELERVYELWGKGNLGVFHTGNIMIHRACLEAKGCAIIDSDVPRSYVPAFARLQRAVTSQSSNPPVLIGQLAHVGRQPASGAQCHPVVAAEERSQSDSANSMHWTRDGIRDIVQRFAFAARVLKEAGFDGVQIHGAYGNIITQLLSRRLNTRTDNYSGSLENRARILLEIIVAIKERVGDPTFMVGIKFSATDFRDGGLLPQELRELARRLEEMEVDYIELSGGAYDGVATAGKVVTHHEDISILIFMMSNGQPNPRQEHFFLFAEQIRSGLTKTKLVVTGGFKTASSMIHAVKSGTADFVGLARSLTHEPMLAKDILAMRLSCAKRNTLPASLAVNLEAGISQIHRMGKGLELRDFSNQKVADEWINEREGKQ